MKRLVILFSIGLLSASSLVFAHGDAKGIVKDRMDLMKDLKGAMKTLKPMIRGKENYDIETVKKNALTIQNSSGEHMTKLFPEGSLDMPSEAKPEIWQEWDNFQRIAADLERFAQALHDGAANNKKNGTKNKKGHHGLMGQGKPMQGQSMNGQGMKNAQGMMRGQHQMGGQGMMGGKHHMNGKGMQSGMGGMSDEELASMPSQGIFKMIGKTCGSCHKKYRVDK